MSALVRFELKDVRYKARVFEHASRRYDCKCCGNKAQGILVRHIDPVKKDTGICHECLVKLALEIKIQVGPPQDGIRIEKYNPSSIVNDSKRRKKKKPGAAKGGRNFEKVECPHCHEMFTKQGLHFHIKSKHPVTDPTEGTETETGVSDGKEVEDVAGRALETQEN